MKTFLFKIGFYLSFFLIASISLYLTSKRNLIFDTPAKKFVKEFTSGDVIVTKEKSEDRRTSYQLAKHFSGKHFNCLFLGSSRIMQLGKNTHFPNSINLGVSAAGLRDIIELQKIVKKFKIGYDTLILDFNPWTVTKIVENHPNQFHALDNLQTGLLDIIKFNFNPENLWELFSNENQFKRANKKDIQNPNYFIRFTDGSIKQKTLGPNMKAGRVDFFCRDLYLLKQFYRIDSNLLNKYLEIILQESQNHCVIVFLSPFHPELFKRRSTDIRVQNLQKLESLFFSKKPKNVKVIGSFNPKNLDFGDPNFIDGFHISESSINILFRKSSKLSAGFKQHNKSNF